MTDLRRQAEDDTVKYADAVQYTDYAISQAQQFQDTVTGASGNGLGLAQLLAGFAPGAALGIFLKRPGDKSPAEVSNIVAKVKEAVTNGSDTNPAATA
jgi:hypothetical protein